MPEREGAGTAFGKMGCDYGKGNERTCFSLRSETVFSSRHHVDPFRTQCPAGRIAGAKARGQEEAGGGSPIHGKAAARVTELS